jgi:hypothetical protein
MPGNVVDFALSPDIEPSPDIATHHAADSTPMRRGHLDPAEPGAEETR